MTNISATSKPHVLWIQTEPLPQRLDAATWLDTTQELRNMGWRVTLISSGSREEKFIRGVEIYSIPKPKVYLLGQMLFHMAIARLILSERRQIDVVLFHQMSSIWIMPLRLMTVFMRWPRPRFVMDTRTLHMAPKKNQRFRDRVRGDFFVFVNYLSHYWVDGQLAITEPMAKAIKIPARQYWGIWPSGVDAKRFQDVQTPRCWPNQGEPLRFIYVGALNQERNLAGFCRALERANAEGIACELLLVGAGTEEEELSAFAATTNGRIRMMPQIPHEQIPDLLTKAHVGILPFPDEEKFRVSSPIKLFEYLASGLAILATRIICITSVTGEDASIFWAEASNEDSFLQAIRQIDRKRDGLPQIGEEMVSFAANWTWGEAARKLARGLEFGLRQRDK